MKYLQIVLILSTLMFVSCSKEQDSKTQDTYDLEKNISNLISEIDNDSDILFIEEGILHPSECISDYILNKNIVEQFQVGINSNTDEGNIILTAITSKISSETEDYEVLYNFRNNNDVERNLIVRLKQNTSKEYTVTSKRTSFCGRDIQNSEIELRWGGWDNWLDCVSGVMSDPIVQIVGVAGTVGCAGCGIAYGVIVGFGAIGCAG